MKANVAGEKILVTGGTGFLGRYVVERLISESADITVLTRNSPSEISSQTPSQIKFAEIDLLDAASVKLFIKESQPDRIVHLAGKVFREADSVVSLESYNYTATVNLLEASAAARIKRIIIIGTADEYGFQPAPQVETMATMPLSDYAISKNKAVKYALSLHETTGLPVVIARPFTIYGVGQPARMFVAQAVECAVSGQQFEMSPGEQKRDLLFVTDFVNAIIKLLTAGDVEGEIYNIGSGEAIALKQLAKKIWQIAGADTKFLKIGERPTAKSELHDTQADISKISRAIGWKPEISLDDGLKQIIEKLK